MEASTTTATPRSRFDNEKTMTITDGGTNQTPATVDDLVRQRAKLLGDQAAVGYPSSGILYVEYGLRQLDVFAWRTARQYQDRLPMRTSSAVKPSVVAMLGPSNFEYIVTMLALIKLGHTILFLSTRISSEAVISLMQTTEAQALISDPRHKDVAKDVQTALPETQLFEIVPQSTFDFPVDGYGDTRLDAHLDPRIETSNNVYIIHSSGQSTYTQLLGWNY
jgi:acyl-CoA synthetase (AMP-forming)/AMP-acid ligase II